MLKIRALDPQQRLFLLVAMTVFAAIIGIGAIVAGQAGTATAKLAYGLMLCGWLVQMAVHAEIASRKMYPGMDIRKRYPSFLSSFGGL